MRVRPRPPASSTKPTLIGSNRAESGTNLTTAKRPEGSDIMLVSGSETVQRGRSPARSEDYHGGFGGHRGWRAWLRRQPRRLEGGRSRTPAQHHQPPESSRRRARSRSGLGSLLGGLTSE